MTNEISTTAEARATYSHESMTVAQFRAYLKALSERTGVQAAARLKAKFGYVEYLNAPAGLIVLAHHDTFDGQVDGIHPATIGKTIRSPRNIIEPLPNPYPDAPAYNLHWMTRRSQGSLVIEAFGRMIHGSDDEAIGFKTDGRFAIEIYSTPSGPIVAAIEGSKQAYVIRPQASCFETREAA